jgi:hypothetical protein
MFPVGVSASTLSGSPGGSSMHWLMLLWMWIAGAGATPYMVQDRSPEPLRIEAFAPEIGPDGVAVPGEGVAVHAMARDQATALRLARHASDATPALARRLGVPAGNDIHVYIAPTEAEFKRLQPGAIPDWADGTAWPLQSLIFLRSPHVRAGNATDLTQVLDHELVHVLLGQAFAPRPVPQWLQEGVAQFVAGEYTDRHLQALENGMLGGKLLTLPELTGAFPEDPVRASMAYAQSADLVAFIVGRYGEDALATLVREMSQGQAFGRSLRLATGLGPSELDEAWRARLATSPLWVRAVTSDTLLMSSGALFLLVGAWSVRRRNRAKLERWRREEALQEALRLALERGRPQPARTTSLWVHPEDGRWVH